MALTKVQVISNALLELGHQPITSLTDGDQLVVAAESAFDFKLPSVLAQGNWRFACQIAELSLTTEIPPAHSQWGSIYLLPAGYLKTIRLIPNIYQWEIFSGYKLYTVAQPPNPQPLLMEYIFQPDVSLLPPHFVDYFIYEIAAFLALSNAQLTTFYQVLEQKRILQMAMAHAVETQNRPQFSQVSFPVLDTRYVSTLVGGSFSS